MNDQEMFDQLQSASEQHSNKIIGAIIVLGLMLCVTAIVCSIILT